MIPTRLVPFPAEPATPPRRRGGPAPLVGAAVLAAALLGLTACGGSGSTTAAAPSVAPSSGAARQGPPGTTGTIAAVSPGVLQLQSQQSGQVAVDYSASVPVTATVSTTHAALVPGMCATAFDGAAGAGTGAGTGAGGGAAAPTAGPVTASTVTISAPTANGCRPGGGGGFTRRAAGGAAPSAAPGRGTRGGGGGGGKILSVTPTSFVVERTTPSGTTTQTTTQTTVLTTPTTTYLQTKAATDAALVVGQCATAIGKANDTGAIAATAISVRAPGPQGCTTGFGRRNGGSA